MDLVDSRTHLFERLRPEAFAIAYRMLGSVSDAEDMVQEALVRLHLALEQDNSIASPQAYLATVVTRLCIDELRSARSRREVYVGEWLPEPLINTVDDAAQRLELSESLSMAFLVLLESLSPEQRAALLLRDVFDYDYSVIAQIIGKSEPAVRQLAVRARSRVLEGRPRFDVTPEQREQLAERFFSAIEAGDLDRLEALLAQDVSLHGDGGGKVPALARPLTGRSIVLRALFSWARAGRRAGGYTIRRMRVNAQAGAAIVSHDGSIVAVWALDMAEDHITAIRSVVNPDKLRHIPGSGDFGEFITRRQ